MFFPLTHSSLQSYFPVYFPSAHCSPRAVRQVPFYTLSLNSSSLPCQELADSDLGLRKLQLTEDHLADLLRKNRVELSGRLLARSVEEARQNFPSLVELPPVYRVR